MRVKLESVALGFIAIMWYVFPADTAIAVEGASEPVIGRRWLPAAVSKRQGIEASKTQATRTFHEITEVFISPEVFRDILKRLP